MKNHTLVYNLYFVEALSLYLPSSIVAEVRKDNTLGYYIAKATPDNVRSFEIDGVTENHVDLVKICEELSIPSLEAKYRKKKSTSLYQLYEDKGVSVLIKQYIKRKMTRFFDVLMEEQFPVCLEVERKTLLESLRLKYASEKLKAVLSFAKTQTGIQYRLKTMYKGKEIVLQNHMTDVIQDDPAFVSIDYTLYALDVLNANKLKPFLKKPSIFIKKEMTQLYFEKFILDVASKTEIEAIGFEVLNFNEVLNCDVKISQDFLNGGYVLDLIFDYGKTTFALSDLNRKKTRLHLDGDQVSILQISRSPKEEDFINAFLSLGLELASSGRLVTSDNLEESLVEWLIKHQLKLRKSGVRLKETCAIGDHKVLLEKPEVDLSAQSNNDWFDIKGKVIIKDFEILFVDLLDNIKNKDPFFILPDGSSFLIPDAWMTRYSHLSKLGERKGKLLRVLKSQYLAIEEDGFSIKGTEVKKTRVENDFTPVSGQLKAKLRPYQQVGYEWLVDHYENGLGACLADDMGLGKTLQTLAVLNYTKDRLDRSGEEVKPKNQLDLFAQSRVNDLNPLRALILLPASLVFNWYQEIKKFSPHFIVSQYLGSQRSSKELDKFDVVLTTYQTALRDVDLLQEITWEYIILDESQAIKNKESKIFKAVNTLKSRHKITLSGTPIENSLSDLWAQMEFINPGLLGTYPFFNEHFKIPIERGKNELALEQLRTLVAPYILRRRKEEVAKDLPELTQMVDYVPMSPEQKKVFDKEKSAARNYLLSLDESDQSYKMHVFTSLLKLRQIANHPCLSDETYEGDSGKFDHVLSKLNTVIKSGQKVLVFSSFTGHLKIYEDYLKAQKYSFSKLTGQSSQQARQRAVSQFQNNKDVQVFLISIKAGGTGLNLTAADYVFILDPWWNPFIEEQAIARAHRIGQENPVTVVRFISKESIEEKILKLQAKKKMLSAELIETQEKINFTRADLGDLLK